MPSTKRPSVRSGLAVFLALAIAGCSSDRIFHADFQADAVGARPALSPPTSPAGDEILFPGAAPVGAERFTVVNSAPLRSKALRYLNSVSERGPVAVAFVSAPPSGSAIREAWVQWTAVPDLAAEAPPLNISIARNLFGTSVALRFDDGKILVRTTAGAETYEEIGRFTNGRVHTVIVNLDYRDGTYGIVVSEQNSPVIATGRRHILDAAPESPRPLLYMAFGGPETSSGTYSIDDVMMRRD